MQLKKRGFHCVSGALAAATCSLLGQAASAAVGPIQDPGDVKLDTAILYYTEKNRVTATEPVVRAKKTLPDDSEVEFKLVLDSLSGASHNGAMFSNVKAQTFTAPSGGGGHESDSYSVTSGGTVIPTGTTSTSQPTTYTVAPGNIPLDKSFHDSRIAVNGQYTHPLSRTFRYTGGMGFSHESDFTALTINGGVLKDLDQKNTTLSFNLGLEQDAINPNGGVPQAFTFQSDKKKHGSGKSRTTGDVLFGITQVLTRRWIMQLNYDVSGSTGYQTDPYKVITIADANGVPMEAETFGATNIGPGDAQLYEKRPKNRLKQAVYWESRYHLTHDVVALSYRYMTDDWGVMSHTAEVRYRWMLHNGWFIEPHFRYYQQTAANFWKPYLTQQDYQDIANGSLTAASADYRLGHLQDRTFGIKVGQNMPDGKQWSARVELFRQSGDTPVASLDALILQLSYSFNY